MSSAQKVLKELSLPVIDREADFYLQYPWALNAFPTVLDMVGYLSAELDKVGQAKGWAESEVLLNIFLLSCSITDTLDDFLAGSVYDLSKVRKLMPAISSFVKAGEVLLNIPHGIRQRRYSSLKQWRAAWADAITDYLQFAIVPAAPVLEDVLKHKGRMANLLSHSLPRVFLEKVPKIPAFFRSRDFTAADCLELGSKFVSAVSDRSRTVVVVGLRTAGSFLAPLLCAFLKSRNFSNVRWVAIRPKKGAQPWEQAVLDEGARGNASAIIVDESIHTGQTLIQTVALLQKGGFRQKDIFVLNPVEPALPNWRNSLSLQALPHLTVINLDPAERSKCRLLDSALVVERIAEYYQARGFPSAEVRSSQATEVWNSTWKTQPPEKVDVRLKRLYEVELQDPGGLRQVRYVLAKSVGSGWLSYHAFLIAGQLQDYLAPMLGLRDGILYSEWIPQSRSSGLFEFDRFSLAERLGAYVGARARALVLQHDPTDTLAREGRHNGFQMLAFALSRVFNSGLARIAQQRRLPLRLAQQSSPTAVLTDSKMSVDEWIWADSSIRKTDFEHHCQGKNELLMTDPAFDLASAIFFFNLSEAEVAPMLDRYIKQTGDAMVENRLYFNKLMVGLWVKGRAAAALNHPGLLERRHEFAEQFASARNFLVRETIRECGKNNPKAGTGEWRSPLVVTDIDGVLDRMLFGFPGTSAAGIQALALLHAHGFSVAVNTARALEEVKSFCQAYGLPGGAAEYGAVVWDAVKSRTIVLADIDSLKELDRVREGFRAIPGILVDDSYLYTVRVYNVTGERTTPVPPLLAQDLLSQQNADRLKIVHTGLDTAIIPKEVDKGKALSAMRRLLGSAGTETYAIGDSEPDLAMFRAADTSFAPANVTCRQEAQALGTWVAERQYQPGMLQIARKIAHPNGKSCEFCDQVVRVWSKNQGLFTDLLKAADATPLDSFKHHMSWRSILDFFQK